MAGMCVSNNLHQFGQLTSNIMQKKKKFANIGAAKIFLLGLLHW